MKLLTLVGLLAMASLFSGCALSVPIRPWMFIQNEEHSPMGAPMEQETEPVEVLPG
ncbi:hypothetical protein [Rubellicoccus peritrichatus]|uniref:Uncharacterized protein n=1 Tax=Rubellicoccus peritrichatus TaxID=3080537 RepID=A0AAQ3QRQ4_9BACT|nr:hypothetical protein [Puniceicoccus sp. CR14]WOO41528.1 hypothetical protein RZN69_00405 [Puniceicoccus sp. CR14]